MMHHISLVACIAILLQNGNVVTPFTIGTSKSIQTTKRATLLAYKSPNSSPLEDEPWKSDPSYWDMLQEASKDPATFEKFIEESKKKRSFAKKSSTSITMATNGEVMEERKTKGKYVPIEEWDRDQKENMSAEERLQWECQRGGNQYRQNEILSHHLSSF
jgi:hypothetical protein